MTELENLKRKIQRVEKFMWFSHGLCVGALVIIYLAK